LIKAGESSGNLEIVFSDLSVSLQREQELSRNIKSALTYPVILLVGSVGILVLLVSFALPKIAGIFGTSSEKIPAFSKVVFAIGLFLNKYIWVFIILALISGTAFWYFFFKTVSGRKIMERFLFKIPVVKNILKHIALQRFATTLASLLKSGLPILDSLEITADAVGSQELKTSLMRISREGVAKGLTIGDAFRREQAFPRVVANLIAISEKAGHTEEILETLANFYEVEIESSIKTLVRFIEPALLLGIGVIIAFIALAVLVPVYQLVGQF
jgi:type IV pilus assembly protein PilC